MNNLPKVTKPLRGEARRNLRLPLSVNTLYPPAHCWKTVRYFFLTSCLQCHFEKLCKRRTAQVLYQTLVSDTQPGLAPKTTVRRPRVDTALTNKTPERMRSGPRG